MHQNSRCVCVCGCALWCCKNLCCASPFFTGRGAVGSRSKQMFKGSCNMLVQGHTLRVLDEAGSQGTSSTSGWSAEAESIQGISPPEPSGKIGVFGIPRSPLPNWIKRRNQRQLVQTPNPKYSLGSVLYHALGI